ncbi:hypothetical protein M514_08517, partial [Trichuris suis]
LTQSSYNQTKQSHSQRKKYAIAVVWLRSFEAMEPLRVHVKWGKEKFDNVLVHLDQSPALFKAQLFSLTGVQPERQKIVWRGKALGNDSWDGFSIKPGCQLLLLGTTGDLPGAPVNKTVFVEDMTPAEVIKAKDLLSGIKNLGNTCYMSATLQCLATVPELMEGFKKFLLSPNLDLGGNRFFMVILAEQFKAMLCGEHEFTTPVVLVEYLCKSFPQFATKDEQGHHQQQDANELWVLLLRLSSELLPFAHKAEGSEETIVSAYLTGEFFITMHSAESGETETDTEQFQQLSCFLTGEVKHLINGLRAKMTEGVTKRSATLERDVVFERKYAISRLPKYLTVQMVRFFYKEKDQVNAKILKDVKFPIELDVYDLCTDELKAKLQPARQMIDDIEEKKKSAQTQANNETSKAVLTHKGRSSNSGHYVAWVRGKREHQWLKCDDEIVSIVTEEEILRLSGGGDWHCAYVLLYGPKVVRRDKCTAQQPSL